MQSLKLPGLLLKGFAQGGIKTSIYCPEVYSVFDVGIDLNIVTKNYFITHGHPDHLKSIINIISRYLIMELDLPRFFAPVKIVKNINNAIYYMGKAMGGWRGGLTPVVEPVKHGDVIPISEKQYVKVYHTFHKPDIKGFSCGYIVFNKVKKLKQEYKDYNPDQIRGLLKQKETITEIIEKPFLAIPGDTQIEFLREYEDAQNAKYLLHEVTIWDNSYSDVKFTRSKGHTHIDEMVRYAHLFKGSNLILVHRSMNYERKFIETVARKRFVPEIYKKIRFFDGGDRRL